VSGRFKGPEAEESISCNLIPMIDIMFLLLLFFMLGADMTQRERADLVLPKADQAREDEEFKEKGETRTVVNVQHANGGVGCATYEARGICRLPDHWVYTIRSGDYSMKALEPQLLAEARTDLEPETPGAGVRLSARHVLIRADQLAPYGDIQRLMELCAKVGLYKIEVAAARPTLE